MKVAGLCHDRGHGLPLADPNVVWKHEECSVDMLRHLLKTNQIDPKEDGLNAIDITFIEEIVKGTKESERKGRTREKFYL